MKINRITRYCFLFMLVITSCKKFLDVGSPLDKVSSEYVYNSNGAAASVLVGMYHDFMKDGINGRGATGISLVCGLSADEFSLHPTDDYFFGGIFQNAGDRDFWGFFYNFIYRINVSIDGMLASKSLAADVRKQLLGEAYFLRAFFYFYLVNLYGDVPLITTSDYKISSVTERTSTKIVYEQIILDLKNAEGLLNEYYIAGDGSVKAVERIRPNKWSAIALLSRVYLYTENWTAAAREADKVISQSDLYQLVNLEDVFLINSKEAILQMQPVDPDGIYKNTPDARIFVLLDAPNPSRPIWVNHWLLESFEEKDNRKTYWLNVSFDNNTNKSYTYFYKYKKYNIEDQHDENLMILRLAELYLIKAESLVYIGDLEGARENINVIRRRAGLGDFEGISKEVLLDEIIKQRQLELFSELGHRWFDLKRTKRIDKIMNIVALEKGGTWMPYKQLYRIPEEDIRLNPKLVQNEGW